jgi:xanthine/uracil/vitamin C permease (AzgA family)
MISNVKDVDFTNIKNAVPAFITIIMMVLSYSITNGIGMGIIIFALLDLIIYYLISLIRPIYLSNKFQKYFYL